MPNYYAHIQYGQKVLDALPKPLAARLEPELEAFYFGLYGPDPLMFWPTTVGAARTVHRKPGGVCVAALRDAVQLRMPMAMGYTAGFLCHFVLDCTCHPYVIAYATRELNHTAIEVEFDRFLSWKNGQEPRGQRPVPRKPASRAVSRVAVLPYGNAVRPATFRAASWTFYRSAAMLTWAQGTPLRGVIHGIGHVPGCSKILGAVPGKHPLPEAHRHALELNARMEEAVAPGAALICAVLEQGPLPAILERNFYGVDPVRGFESGE